MFDVITWDKFIVCSGCFPQDFRVGSQVREFDPFAPQENGFNFGHEHLCFRRQIRGDFIEGAGKQLFNNRCTVPSPEL